MVMLCIYILASIVVLTVVVNDMVDFHLEATATKWEGWLTPRRVAVRVVAALLLGGLIVAYYILAVVGTLIFSIFTNEWYTVQDVDLSGFVIPEEARRAVADVWYFDPDDDEEGDTDYLEEGWFVEVVVRPEDNFRDRFLLSYQPIPYKGDTDMLEDGRPYYIYGPFPSADDAYDFAEKRESRNKAGTLIWTP